MEDRATCISECESFLRNTQQGSICGLRKKDRGASDFEGTLAESERANTNAHRHEYKSTDMFGNDLRKTDSFGTPRDQQVWVGRTEGDRRATVPFKTVQEAEHFIAQLEVFFPEEVRAGNFYIDAPEAVDHV